MSKMKSVSLGTSKTLAGALLFGSLVSCGGASPETHEGELVVQAGIMLDGSTVTRYLLRTANGTEIELDFAHVPSRLSPGDRLRVEGQFVAERKLHVENLSAQSADGESGVLRERLIAPGTRSVAMLLVHWNGPGSLTPEAVSEQLFTGSASAAAHYAESSFGLRSFDGDVFDWLPIAPVPSCDTSALAAAADAAAAGAGIDLGAYDHVGYLVAPSSNCSFSGFGDVGVPAAPARRTWYNASPPTDLLVHELGHNLGYWHAHSYACPAAIGPRWQCSFFAEYGDPYDPMASSLAHFNAYDKLVQGWFPNCGVVTATSDAVFTLEPTEISTTGVQALRVPMAAEFCPPPFPTEPPGIGGPCYYYIEHRQPIGFDALGLLATAPMHDGVLVHANVGVDLAGLSGLTGTSLLDMTPGSGSPFNPFEDANLGVGRVFGDASGARIRVLSQDGQSVRVAVKVPNGSGAPVCLDGSPAATPASCDNGLLDAGETAVDCGGPTCVPCDEGQACSVHADCWSDNCVAGVCAIACDDGARNGTETDIDCGGSCGDCGVGQTCSTNADCQSNRCTAGGYCTSAELSATLTVHSDWSSGFCGSLTLVNTAATPTIGWQALVNFEDSSFTTTSGAVFTPVDDGVKRLTPEPTWGSQIWPSSHHTISFCATKTGPNYFPELLYDTARY
jgi:hypothetical protein